MKKGATILIVTLTLFLGVVFYAIDPIYAAIGPIGITQETLGKAIRDDAVARFNMMADIERLQEELGRAITIDSSAHFEWKTNVGIFQEELGKAIRDDAVLRRRGVGNMQEEIGRAIVNLTLLNYKISRSQERLGTAVRDEASTRYNSMVAIGKHQERLGEAIKMDAVTRFKMAGTLTLGLNQEEVTVPVGEDEALPYTTLLLVGLTIGATASCFFAWAIACPKYEGTKAEEEETEVSIAA